MKIAVVSGSRADYGLLRPVALRLKDDDFFELDLVLTGAHLACEASLAEVEEDFSYYTSVPCLGFDDTKAGITRSMGKAMEGFAEYFASKRLDLILLLGDRYEIFAVAAAALIAGVPIAHMCGGELSFGAYDEGLRHAITKLSALHFCTTKDYALRVISMGEDPRRVLAVGSTAPCSTQQALLSKAQLEDRLHFSFKKRNFIITFHPVTKEENSLAQLEELLKALDEYKDIGLIFTSANADNGARELNARIQSFVNANSKRAVFHTSLGQLAYFSTLGFVDAVVGNSSSGISEASSFKIATINIGNRQKGRIAPLSVLHAKAEASSIKAAINRLFEEDFKQSLKSVKNPYDLGDAALKIVEFLKGVDVKSLQVKEFYEKKA